MVPVKCCIDGRSRASGLPLSGIMPGNRATGQLTSALNCCAQHPQAAGAYTRAGHVNEGRLFLLPRQAINKITHGKCRPEAHHRAAKTYQVKIIHICCVLIISDVSGYYLNPAISKLLCNMASYPAGISRCSMKIDQCAMAHRYASSGDQ
jgi:hypothetical protein